MVSNVTIVTKIKLWIINISTCFMSPFTTMIALYPVLICTVPTHQAIIMVHIFATFLEQLFLKLLELGLFWSCTALFLEAFTIFFCGVKIKTADFGDFLFWKLFPNTLFGRGLMSSILTWDTLVVGGCTVNVLHAEEMLGWTVAFS